MFGHPTHAPLAFLPLWGGSLRSAGKKGFTIVEVMVAATVFTMVTLGVYSALIQSYKFTKLSRCHDESRAILRTYVDQFQRLQTVDEATGSFRWLFMPTSKATGQGLVWGQLNDQSSAIKVPDAAYLEIPLGTSTSPVKARLTRNVTYVNPTTGEPSNTSGTGSTFLLQAVFEITFDLNGRTHTRSMTVMRSAP